MAQGVERFEDLITWQLADALRREVFAFTETGRAARDFKYRDQVRDASSSAARNTAEGFGRFRPSEFARFLEFAHGSLNEVQDGLLEGRDRRYLDEATFERLWILSKRALGVNTRLMLYLKDCAAKGLQPWLKREHDTRPGTNFPDSEELENPEP
jgi:four helix bundle protein